MIDHIGISASASLSVACVGVSPLWSADGRRTGFVGFGRVVAWVLGAVLVAVLAGMLGATDGVEVADGNDRTVWVADGTASVGHAGPLLGAEPLRGPAPAGSATSGAGVATVLKLGAAAEVREGSGDDTVEGAVDDTVDDTATGDGSAETTEAEPGLKHNATSATATIPTDPTAPSATQRVRADDSSPERNGIQAPRRAAPLVGRIMPEPTDGKPRRVHQVCAAVSPTVAYAGRLRRPGRRHSCP